MPTIQSAATGGFTATRLGVIMTSQPGNPHEAWGVLNPGGVRAANGTMHLFPRLIAEGNYSRIGHAQVSFADDIPTQAQRLWPALEPRESYEVSAGGGGVEDARVVYVPLLKRYVMTYTAFVPYEPRVAIAISEDLDTWQRLGVLRYAAAPGEPDLNGCGNKDAAFFPDVVADPHGVPSFAILHRPTTRIHFRRHHDGVHMVQPPCGEETQENIWISYIPVEAAVADIANLTSVHRHETVMAPEQEWETKKVGNGAPPVRLPYGWLLLYHGVSTLNGSPRYSMGAAILDLETPSRVLFRTRLPILEPQTDYECRGLIGNVVFPSATGELKNNTLDVYYGAADHVIAAARLEVPTSLPVNEQAGNVQRPGIAHE